MDFGGSKDKARAKPHMLSTGLPFSLDMISEKAWTWLLCNIGWSDSLEVNSLLVVLLSFIHQANPTTLS